MAQHDSAKDALSKEELMSETHSPVIPSSITPLHAPLLEGWPPTASHLYTAPLPPKIPSTVTSTAIATTVAPTQSQDAGQDVEMTDIRSNNDAITTTNTNDANSLSLIPSSETVNKPTTHISISKAAGTPDESIEKNSHKAANPAMTSDPELTATGKANTFTSPSATIAESVSHDNAENVRATSTQNIDPTIPSSTKSMPKAAPLHGAPLRRYLNENVTGVLLEGMKVIAKDRPSNPLHALGEYLIQRSKEIK